MNNKEWITVKDAAKIRNCTDRTILRMIEKKEVESKRDGKRWLILRSSLSDDIIPTDNDMVLLLKAQLQQREAEVKQLQEELSNVRQRSDTIILQLTQQNQLMLEDKTTPWWQKLFKRKMTLRTPENVMDMEPDIEETGTPEGERK